MTGESDSLDQVDRALQAGATFLVILALAGMTRKSRT
jgi:hypothetical protein